MAQTPFSLLLLRRLTLSSQNPKLTFLPSILKPFSTSQPSPSSSSEPPPKPSSLSSRLSFVFDQIDAIGKQQQQSVSQKDQTLLRIRAWRQDRKPQTDPPPHSEPEPSQLGLGLGINSNDEDAAGSMVKEEEEKKKKKKMVEVVHPWPEWIELIERLVGQNYFDHRRKDEDSLVQELGFDAAEIPAVDDDLGIDFTKDYKAVQTACLNFGKDRFDILRSLSRQDIQTLVGFGCPSVDKKVVFSAKLLRKRVQLDEGDVCSSCSLRNSCERGYLLTNKEDEARTIDIMRVLLAFGFDPMNGSVVNKALLKQKSIKNVVRKVLHEVVKLSSVPIDPNLPPPVIKKPPPKVKQAPPPPRKRVGRDDVEMKRGDWLCPKCDFLNFAKNTICLQCDAKRPKRQLLPGEWECPECNFLNYRRNMACFHCECKRPPDGFMENKMQENQRGPRTRLEKTAQRQEVSNAWNFDFDDNESDGADVAAFEYADASVMAEDSPLDNQAHGGNFRGPEDNFSKSSRVPRAPEKEYSDGDTNRPGMGFDDFEDEEDNIDSYELEIPHNNSARKASSNDFSEAEGYSGSEDFESINNNVPARGRPSSPSYNKPSKSMRVNAAFSGSEDDLDSDEDLSVHPNWKSSHVADSRQRGRGRGQAGPSKRLSFGSDEELGLYSDVDDDSDDNFRSRQRNGNKLGSGRRDFRRKESSDVEDGRFSGPKFDNDDMRSSRNRLRGNKEEPDRRRNMSQGRASNNFTRDTKFRSGGKMGSRWNTSNDDFDEPTQRSRGNNRGSQKSRHDGGRKRDREGDMWDFKERGRGGDGFGKQQRGRGGDSFGKQRGRGGDSFGKQQRGRGDRDMDRDSGEFKNSRRVIVR